MKLTSMLVVFVAGLAVGMGALYFKLQNQNTQLARAQQENQQLLKTQADLEAFFRACLRAGVPAAGVGSRGVLLIEHIAGEIDDLSGHGLGSAPKARRLPSLPSPPGISNQKDRRAGVALAAAPSGSSATD